ncbi:MAG: antibiotic biosynthesis monooxygenase [Acidimicrobiia bacterium]|nr:antibiotic biosynthesis monooxygenase [Acidimicrobiia bacterium]NNC91030.1 antibiotic biosynthesis monooxygenase [Acidimicrobiia bacterium]
MTVAVFASFRPRAEDAGTFLAAMQAMIRDSRSEPGCLRYDLFRAETGVAGYHLFEVYADPAAIEAHRSSDHYRRYRSIVPDLLAEPIDVVVLEPIDIQA